MEGQRIHKWGANSQPSSAASWCESSTLKLVKASCCAVSVTVKNRGELCRCHVQGTAWTTPSFCSGSECSHVQFTVSQVPLERPTFVSTAGINNCFANLLHRRHLGLGIRCLWEIYGFGFLGAPHACDIVCTEEKGSHTRHGLGGLTQDKIGCHIMYRKEAASCGFM